MKTAKNICLAMTMLITGQAFGDVITFTDQAAWEGALSGADITTAEFEGAESSFAANSTGNDIGPGLTLDLIGGVGDPGPTGLTGDGQLEFEVDSSSKISGDGLDIRINTPLVHGFALLGLTDNSASSPAVNLHEIGIVVNGFSFLISDILGLTSGSDTSAPDATAPFVGFVSNVAIDTFTFVHGDLIRPVLGSNERYWLDGLSIAQVTAVPEPGTLALLGLGLVGMAARRRKTV